MMSKELYIQVEKCLADSESEATVCHIKELKKLGESDNKDLLRLERVCLDQLYYLLNESLNRCDVASSQRLTHSYLSLKNDGRIALMQQKLKLLEKQEQLKSSSGNVNCDSVSEKNGRRFFKRSNILKIAGFILILSIIVGIIVYTDEQGMWADKAMTAAKATADSIRIADSIAAFEAAAFDAAAKAESEEHISRVVSTYTYRGEIDEKYPISLTITREGNKVFGNYYYLRNGSNHTLDLQGEIVGNKIQIWEYNSKGENTGFFDGEVNESEYWGVFTNYKGIKMSFYLQIQD